MLESLLPLAAQQAEELLVGGICLIMAFWFIVWLVIAILVYRDADSRGMNGILWFLIVLIFGIIGIIIYLIVRKEKQQPPPPPPPS